MMRESNKTSWPVIGKEDIVAVCTVLEVVKFGRWNCFKEQNMWLAYQVNPSIIPTQTWSEFRVRNGHRERLPKSTSRILRGPNKPTAFATDTICRQNATSHCSGETVATRSNEPGLWYGKHCWPHASLESALAYFSVAQAVVDWCWHLDPARQFKVSAPC